MDPIENIMGGFGRYHVYLYLIMSISQTYPAFQQIGIVFLAPKVPYTCDGVKNACPCPNPKFDRSVFPNTIIMQWNLICEKKMLVSFTQTMFQLGTLTGSVVFGMAADRYGRKKPMLFAVLCQIIFGILVAYVPSYWAFTFIRFLIGMTVGGVMVVGFVILMEFVGTKYREATSAMVQFPFNMGHMLLPLIAYYFREYKQLLLAVSIPSLLMLPYFVLLPETPRWLLAAKKTEKAIKIIEKVTKMNKRDTANLKSKVEAFQAVLEANKLKRGTILDLFRTPNIRKNIICVSLDWLACSYCFYGVSQFVGQLGGSIFINVFISAAVTTCGTLVSVPWMKMSGRKTIIIVNCYICAACLILLAFLPEGLVSVILASFGVVCSFIMFIVVYLYSAEMFPTVVRNAAIGFSSMIARIGSMVAPFVIDLGDISRMLPPLVFALVPLISGTTTFLLPETKGCPLLTTVEEGERFGKKQQHTTET